MDKISSYREALTALGGPTQVARILRAMPRFANEGSVESRVLQWFTRNKIPGAYWYYIAQVAAKAGRPDINEALLARLSVKKNEGELDRDVAEEGRSDGNAGRFLAALSGAALLPAGV